MKITPTELYNKLINEDKILREKGQITFKFADIDIVVKQKDVVGNIIQEWLQGWLTKNNIDFEPSENSQMPPDFYLDPDNKTRSLLEVKAFNKESSPGFDIADFRMYEEEIIEKPYMLDVDYLVFGYKMDKNGNVTVKNLWIKKVWEITRRMEKWALNLQIKQNVVHKIRPGVFYSTRPKKYTMFRCLEDFIAAVEETVYQNPKTRETAGTWKANFLKSYEKFYGIKLKIPRWTDIADSYIAKDDS